MVTLAYFQKYNNDGNSNNQQLSPLGTAVRIVWVDATA